MNNLAFYENDKVGEQLVKMYKGRNKLRRQIPLMSANWQYLVRCLKGEAALKNQEVAQKKQDKNGSVQGAEPARA